MARSTADVLSLTEIAKRTGYDRDTIKRWIRSGKDPGYTPSPGVYVVTRQQYALWLAGEFRPVEKTEDAA